MPSKVAEFNSSVARQWYKRTDGTIVNLTGIRVRNFEATLHGMGLSVEFEPWGREVQGMHELMVLVADMDVHRSSVDIGATIYVGERP